MNINQLNELLNKACEIITSLETYADSELKNQIDALFNEIKYSSELDEEMSPDNQAQDWDTFGTDKI